MNKRLKNKIEEAKKLIEELKQDGVCAELDEKTGEITIKFSEFIAKQDVSNDLFQKGGYMKVKELRELLEEYDGEMEVITYGVDRDVYEILGIGIDCKRHEARLALTSEMS